MAFCDAHRIPRFHVDLIHRVGAGSRYSALDGIKHLGVSHCVGCQTWMKCPLRLSTLMRMLCLSRKLLRMMMLIVVMMMMMNIMVKMMDVEIYRSDGGGG